VELLPQLSILKSATKYANTLGPRLSDKVVEICEGNFCASPVHLYDKQLEASNDKKYGF